MGKKGRGEKIGHWRPPKKLAEDKQTHKSRNAARTAESQGNLLSLLKA